MKEYSSYVITCSKEEILIRSEANENAKIVLKASNDVVYKIVDIKDKWVKIKLNQFYMLDSKRTVDTAYVLINQVRAVNIKKNINRYMKTNDNNINIREFPSTNSRIIGRINSKDSIVKTGDYYGKWVNVFINGTQGYVFGEFLVPANNELEDKENLLICVNKKNSLTSDYIPPDLVHIENSWYKLRRIAYSAYKDMYLDAINNGIDFNILLAYIDYETQKNIYESFKQERGISYVDKYIYLPGHDEHQTGLAIDLSIKSRKTDVKFCDSNEYIWLKNNSHKYGFIERYPKGKEHITGHQWEPWHYRYVGLKAAKLIYDKDLTLEEYLEFVDN